MVRLPPQLRGLPRTYWLLWAGTLINRLGGFVVPFLTLYLTSDRHLSVAEAGTIVSVYGAGSLFAGPIAGALSDRFGRRRVMLGGLFCGAASMLLLGLARSPAMIALCTLVTGSLGESYRPAVNAMIADVVPPQDRERAYGLQYWAVNLGFAIAPVVAGALADRSYTALFIGDAATTALYGFIAWRWIPESRPAVERRVHAPALEQAGGPFRDGVFLSFALLNFVLAILFFQSQVALPVDMKLHGFKPADYGSMIAINGMMIVVLQPFAAQAIRRFRRGSVLALGALLTGIGYGVLALWATPVAYAVSVAIWTLGEICQAPISPTIVADLAPPGLRGSYQGVFQMSWGLAFCAAPVLGGWVIDRGGTSVVWIAAVVIGVFVAIGHLMIASARRARMTVLRASAAGLDVSGAED